MPPTRVLWQQAPLPPKSSRAQLEAPVPSSPPSSPSSLQPGTPCILYCVPLVELATRLHGTGSCFLLSSSSPPPISTANAELLLSPRCHLMVPDEKRKNEDSMIIIKIFERKVQFLRKNFS